MAEKKRIRLRSLSQLGLRDQSARLPIVMLVQRLLKFCRRHQIEYHESLNDGNVRAWEELLIDRVRDYCNEHVEHDQFSRFDLNQLNAILEDTLEAERARSHGTPPLVVWARGLARGIDCALGSKFHSYFRLQHQSPNLFDAPEQTIDARPNMPFPAAPLALKKESFHGLAFHPSACDDYVDRLPNLRIVPKELPLRVKFDLRLDHYLGDLVNGQPTRYAVGCLGDVDFDRLKKYFRIDDRDDHCFRDVCWRHPEDLYAIFDRAVEINATALVFPELCLDENCLEELTQRFRTMSGSSLRLLVAGSVHMSAKGKLRNRLHAFVRTSELSGELIELSHDKIGAFVWRSPDGRVLLEGIHRERSLTIYLVSGVAIAFLICRDFLQQAVIDTLRELGVRQLFVVAMSKETAEFVAHATYFAVVNNAISTIACISPLGQPGAIFAAPRRLPEPATSLSSRTPEVLWYDSDTGQTDSASI